MQGPVATPVVVEDERLGLELLVNVVGEEILNTGILGKRNVRSQIEEKSTVVTERCSMAAMVAVLIVHHRGDALSVEPVRGTEPAHPSSQYDYVWH